MIETDAFHRRIRLLEEVGRDKFSTFQERAVIRAEYSDPSWLVRGRRMRFPKPCGDFGGAALSVCDVLGRCFVIDAIEDGLSLEGIHGRLYGFNLLAEDLGHDADAWRRISPVVFNRTVARIARTYLPTTTYCRANAIGKFVQFLNATRVGSGSAAGTVLDRYLSWRPRLRNPTRHAIEVGDDSAVDGGKFVPDLHKGIGEARARVRADPTFEPAPGYDLIRLESLAFAMATGMRIGEVAALSISCMQRREDGGTLFIRVPNQKGQPAAARPISEIWEPAVLEAHDYLMEACRGARQRALDIERRGFAFVDEELRKVRAERGVPTSFSSQLAIAGLDPDNCYQIAELTRAFDVSGKEFVSEGKYADCGVQLPRIIAARFVEWMEARFAKWDWTDFCVCPDKRTGQSGSRCLPASQIALHLEGGRSCLVKADWFYGSARDFLILLSREGVFEGKVLAECAKRRIAAEWKRLRALALSRQGGGQCWAVRIDRLKAELVQRYKRHLQQHYRELVSFDDEGKPHPGRLVRQGVPRSIGTHLVVLWENQFSGQKGLGILPRPIFRSDYYRHLSSTNEGRTIFERLSITNSQGHTFSIHPHQIRHWVTTAIFRSGPSEALVDLWMGRTPFQSRIYDHRTAAERAEVMRDRYLAQDPPDDYLGRQVKEWRESGLSEEMLEEHLRSRLRVLHFVPTGTCSRELFLSPCEKGLMCLKGFGTESACPSFLVDPTDLQAKRAIETMREQYMAMLRVLYPAAADLREVFNEELNSEETIDQHISHIRDVIRGCDQALKAYAARPRTGKAPRTVHLEVI